MKSLLGMCFVVFGIVISCATWAQKRLPRSGRVPHFAALPSREQQRQPIPGEFIISVKNQRGLRRFSLANEFSEAQVLGVSPRSGAIMKVKYRSLVNFDSAARALARAPDVAWTSPNYLYTGDDPREGINDPLFTQQYHHPVMKNPEAWSVLKGRVQPIVVAVTDDGVELAHEDLRNMIHINSKEIPNNGIDDDNNNYIDDVAGWNTLKNNNDPNPNPKRTHGTHVAGIIAAEPNNSKGVAGTAAVAARIMALKFHDEGWTTESVVRAYMYAADNGAKIISTSYNVDGFVGDKAFEAAIRYVHDKGLIHFNSAGNNNEENPKRVLFQELILVCSTVADGQTDDLRSKFSNFGALIHICSAGGGGTAGILSTVPDGQYSRASGTSMATPNAAAVAALIWAKYPQMTRDQVVAQLFGTADVIDGKNPGYEGKLGSGRTNALHALTRRPRRSRIAGIFNLAQDGTLMDRKQLVLTVQGVITPVSSNNPNFYRVTAAGADQRFGTGDDRVIPHQLAREVLYGSRAISLAFSSQLPQGLYKVQVLGSKMSDPFDQNLEADFEQEFKVAGSVR